MARKKRRTPAARGNASAPQPQAGAAARSGHVRPTGGRAWWVALAVVFLVAIGCGFLYFWSSGPEPVPPKTIATQTKPPLAVQYVGSDGCAECHRMAYQAWRGSQHAVAMQKANVETILGNFNDARYTHAGVTSTFFERDGKYYVNTDGPDGNPADFEIRYTFGIAPLQQYLIEMPGGRVQALGIAWDARPKAQGGQRWFHLYPDRKFKASDALHWTGIDQNWNFQCADCHSTNLRKNYNETTRTFGTTWSEISIGCEACHGPASNHLAWAKKSGEWRRFETDKGLTVALNERRNAEWIIDSNVGNARRSIPRQSNREIEVCASCHARRGQLSDVHRAGQPLHDAFRPALIEPGLYYSDGQQRDEVYTYASFLQSKMFAQGVTCSDCHDPHTQRLRADGNAVCTQCHQTSKYESVKHHHHADGSKGAQCAACHMPTTTYMVVDPRHDHSFRIPRPDHTVALGTPNACSQCHTGRSAQWTADTIARWYPQPSPGFQSFAEAFHAAELSAPGAQKKLLAIVADAAQPALVRASAIVRLGRFLSPTTLATLTNALSDVDANVRMAAVGALSGADAATRGRVLPRMLDDRLRVVRIEAARALAGQTEAHLPAERRHRFDEALAEYVAVQRFNADRPESHANLGALHLARARSADAEAAFRVALEIDPAFAPAAVSLADLYRLQGREREAEGVLRKFLKGDIGSAVAYHALGLSLVRQKRMPEALAALAQAAKLAPEDPRFAYVYGVALHDAGRRAESEKTLEAALTRHPYDRDILLALATYDIEAGNRARAGKRARLLRDLEPDNQEFARLAAKLVSGERDR